MGHRERERNAEGRRKRDAEKDRIVNEGMKKKNELENMNAHICIGHERKKKGERRKRK